MLSYYERGNEQEGSQRISIQSFASRPLKDHRLDIPFGSYFIMLSFSATLVRRVVYIKPVPAVDSIRAITTLMEEDKAERWSVRFALFQPQSGHICPRLRKDIPSFRLDRHDVEQFGRVR